MFKIPIRLMTAAVIILALLGIARLLKGATLSRDHQIDWMLVVILGQVIIFAGTFRK